MKTETLDALKCHIAECILAGDKRGAAVLVHAYKLLNGGGPTAAPRTPAPTQLAPARAVPTPKTKSPRFKRGKRTQARVSNWSQDAKQVWATFKRLSPCTSLMLAEAAGRDCTDMLTRWHAARLIQPLERTASKHIKWAFVRDPKEWKKWAKTPEKPEGES